MTRSIETSQVGIREADEPNQSQPADTAGEAVALKSVLDAPVMSLLLEFLDGKPLTVPVSEAPTIKDAATAIRGLGALVDEHRLGEQQMSRWMDGMQDLLADYQNQPAHPRAEAPSVVGVREAVKKRLLAYLFEACQPDRGDVFGWFDDHADEALDFALAALSSAGQGSSAQDADTQPDSADSAGQHDWSEHEDDLSDAIADSIDMDWNSRDGAKAVVRWLNENAPRKGDA